LSLTVDLHLHTTASDGMYSPAEIVAAACARGLGVIAITDHDTLAGVEPAIAAAAGTPLCVMPGVELNALYESHSVHLLGYGFDPGDPRLAARLSGMRCSREQRARLMVGMLADLGARISWDRVQALSQGTIARPHIARALVEAGHAHDVADAFARFIGDGCPAYLPSGRMSVSEALGVVRDAGGDVALAHAKLLHPGLDLKALLEVLCAAGLTGLEVYHSEHDEEATAELRRVARERGLWWCGGSDFHGATKPQARLGGVPIPPDVLEQGPFPRALAAAGGAKGHSDELSAPATPGNDMFSRPDPARRSA